MSVLGTLGGAAEGALIPLGPLGPVLGATGILPTPGKINDDLAQDSKAHLTAILQRNGWPANLAPTAAAVSMAESGGDENVVNPTACSPDGDHAVGLMQVCTVNVGIAGFSSDKDTFKKQMQNYDNNAKAGYAIYQSQGWGAWSTYTSGAYKKHMGQDPLLTTGKNSATGAVTGAVSDTVDAATSAAKSVAKIVAALFDPSTYFRLGKGILGGILLILGTAALVFMIANKVSGGKVATATKDAAATAAMAAAVA